MTEQKPASPTAAPVQVSAQRRQTGSVPLRRLIDDALAATLPAPLHTGTTPVRIQRTVASSGATPAIGTDGDALDTMEEDLGADFPDVRVRRAFTTGSNEVVHRKLLFEGKWYGKDDAGDLSKKRLDGDRHLPGWIDDQLNSETQFYTLNSSQTEWVKDQRVDYTRFPSEEGKGKIATKVGLSHPDVEPQGESNERVLPKNLEKRVKKATLVKEKSPVDPTTWHWTLECEVEGGKREKVLSIDLNMHSHRAYYGAPEKVAKPDDMENYEKVPFSLKGEGTTVGAVYEAMLAVASEDGGWTDTAGYNCQNFVLAMLSKLDVNETSDLKREADWRDEERASAEIGQQFHEPGLSVKL